MTQSQADSIQDEFNQIFEANLKALSKNHPNLAQDLNEHIVEEQVEYFLAASQDVNLTYKGLPLHSIENPYQEAKILFDREVDTETRDNSCVYIHFGWGLGYLVQRAFVESEAQMIIYEPNKDVLKQVFQVVDFTKILSSERIKVITNLDDLLVAFHTTHIIGDKLIPLVLPEYEKNYPQLCKAFLEDIRQGIYHNTIAQNTNILLMEEFTRTSLSNIKEVLRYPSPEFLHDQFEGYKGVVVGAGPSLDKPGVIESLKKHRDELIICCVGQAAKTLDKHGIIPDFVYIIEFADVSQQLEGVSYLDETNLVLIPQTNSKIYQFPSKRKMIAHMNGDSFTEWMCNTIGQNYFTYKHHGTVSISCMLFLMFLGCGPIYLLGQDLAYPEGKMYSSSSVYKNVHFKLDENGNATSVEWDQDVLGSIMGKKGFFRDEEELQTRNANMIKGLVTVKGWNGEKLYTAPDYAAFGKAFEHLRDVMDEKHIIINCSEGGRYLEGYIHLPFEQGLKDYTLQKKSETASEYLERLCLEGYQENPEWENKRPYELIQSQIKSDCQTIKEIENLVKENEELVNKLLKEIELKKTVTKSATQYIRKLETQDRILSDYCKEHKLINNFVRKELYLHERDHNRKMKFDQREDHELQGDIQALKESLEASQFIYATVGKGAFFLRDTFNDLLENQFGEKNEKHHLSKRP